MSLRGALHKLVDDLPDEELLTATRVLEALRATTEPVPRALSAAPDDDQADDDDFDAGLSEARREAQEGKTLSHDKVRRELAPLTWRIVPGGST